MSQTASPDSLGDCASERLVVASHAPARTEARSPAHLGAIDWLRLIAILGIVYYHAADVWYPYVPGAWLAFAGLHALTAAACYFAAASRSATSDGQILVRRFHRLIVPWFVFSLPHMLSAIHSGKFQPWMLWMGGAMHLWFLPFIYIVGCSISIARRHGLIERGGLNAVCWTIAALGATALEPFLGPMLPQMGGAWQVINALPAALLGVAIFTLPDHHRRRDDVIQLLAIATVAVALGLLGPVHARSWPPVVAFGTLLFGIARLLPIPATRASTFIGRTTFGVYLMHMMAMLVVVKLTGRLLGNSSDPQLIVIFAQIALAVVACIAAVAILERTPLRRFVA